MMSVWEMKWWWPMTPCGFASDLLWVSKRVSHSASGSGDYSMLKDISHWQQLPHSLNEAEHPCCNCHLFWFHMRVPKQRLKWQKPLHSLFFGFCVWLCTWLWVLSCVTEWRWYHVSLWHQNRFVCKNRPRAWMHSGAHICSPVVSAVSNIHTQGRRNRVADSPIAYQVCAYYGWKVKLSDIYASWSLQA